MLCSHFLCKAYKKVLCDITYKMAGFFLSVRLKNILICVNN